LEVQNIADHGIRIGARGSGKCALEYYIAINKQPLPGDTIHIKEGLSFFMDSFSVENMRGIELDYSPEVRPGFLFRDISDAGNTGCLNCCQ